MSNGNLIKRQDECRSAPARGCRSESASQIFVVVASRVAARVFALLGVTTVALLFALHQPVAAERTLAIGEAVALHLLGRHHVQHLRADSKR